MRSKIIRNGLLILMFLVLFLPGLAANGLQVVPTTILINKTVGIDETIVISISNQEPFVFYNVSFDTGLDSIITMPRINELASGTNQSISAIVKANVNVDQDVRIKGRYVSNIGQQNLLHNVNLTTSGSNLIYTPQCTFDVVKGDSVQWSNNASWSLEMRTNGGTIPNSNTVMAVGTSYTKLFDTPGQFIYRFYVGEFPFTNCIITVRDINELVNNPQLDAIMHLKVVVNYLPTNISINVVDSIFTVNAFNSQDGVMSITNTGSEIAKGVHLKGEWFSFNANDFDLSVGQTKGIVYTISPTVSSSTDTNKTYNKTITFSGNFNTVTRNFTIFVPFSNIATGGGNSSEDLDTLLRGFCDRNPVVCRPIQVIQGNNGSDNVAQVNITQEQFRDIWIHIFESEERRKTLENYLKENLESITTKTTANSETIEQLKTLEQQAKEDQESSMKQIIIFFIIAMFVVCIFIVGVLLFYRRQKNKQEALRRY